MKMLVSRFIELLVLLTQGFVCSIVPRCNSSSERAKSPTASAPQYKHSGGGFFTLMIKAVFVLLLLFVVSVGLLFFSHMNQVPKLDETVKAQWSQVQNQYKRRADLIPNLISAVKGYATHEKETLMQVTDARTNVGKINITADMVDNPELMTQYLGLRKPCLLP